MKKLIITSVIALTVALVASSANAAYSRNLTVGSTGTDVADLQTYLIGHGFSIPAGATAYFGSQTKAAVIAYQSAKGLPATGFFGPLTTASVMANDGVAGNTVMPATCPAGYTCTSNAPVTVNCPAGFTCTSNTAGTTVGTTGGITTVGAVGTLDASLWTTPSGVIAYKGQSYDVASYRIQASASDMALQNLTLDFDARLWLYASSVTVKDDSGMVVGTVSNLNASNFSELTVGSQYRLSVPVNNYVVKSTQIKYLTVNISFLPTSDRATGAVTITQAQLRSVDGTGVTNTSTVSGTNGTRAFTYQGSGAGSIIVTTDSTSPLSGLVGLSTSVQTQNVTLAIFDVKSQNAASTMRKVSFQVATAGNASVASLFSNIKLVAGGQTYSANSIVASTSLQSTSIVTFENLAIPLAGDTYVPLKVMADVAVDTNNGLDNTYSTTTLVAAGSTAGTTNNPVVEDASYNTLDVNEAIFTSNALNFTASSVAASNLTRTYGTLSTTNAGTSTQKVTFSFSLTAGNNPIYLSKTQGVALSTSTNPSGIVVTASDFSDSDSNGDSASVFYLSPGQTKTFTATYSATGMSTATGGSFNITSINFGTASDALTTGALNSSDISNNLKAILFN